MNVHGVEWCSLGRDHEGDLSPDGQLLRRSLMAFALESRRPDLILFLDGAVAVFELYLTMITKFIDRPSAISSSGTKDLPVESPFPQLRIVACCQKRGKKGCSIRAMRAILKDWIMPSAVQIV